MPDDVDGHFDESVAYEELERHAGFIKSQFPKLKHVSIIRIWAGVFGMTPDRLPYIGAMPGYDNYFINTGYSNGMAYCPIGAKLISEYILENGKTSIPLDLVRPDRYWGQKFDIPKRYNYTSLEHLLDEWDL
jgi:glycine/D-amino acid oxidase-like deaminating enzyme